jgi:hypothetical protein
VEDAVEAIPSNNPEVEDNTARPSSDVKTALKSVSTKEVANSRYLDGPASLEGALPRIKSHSS